MRLTPSVFNRSISGRPCHSPPPVCDKLLAKLRRCLQTGESTTPCAFAMAEQHLQAFITAAHQDPALQQQLSSPAAADADEVAAIARVAGFDVHPNDLVNHAGGALVEYEDEDYFMKPLWWELAD